MPLRKNKSPKVCKFGGSSLADAAQLRKVREIIRSDPARRYVVPSAPGRSPSHEHKLTDLLYLCHSHVRESLPFAEVFGHVGDRFKGIARELGLKLDLESELRIISRKIAAGASAAYTASRGEYLCGRILAEFLGFEFVDAAELIRFDKKGRLDAGRTNAAISKRLAGTRRAVIPGYYGRRPDGSVEVFSRGGSDVTGALVARGVRASVYENWTDVSGLRMADPAIVENPLRIETITYRELRELSYMGARVLHDEAVFPVREAGIPVHVLNTNRPSERGTRIVNDAPLPKRHGGVSGIAGRRGFTVIALEKALMNQELGFGRRVLDVFARRGVNYEHTPTGIDSLGVIVESAQLEGKLSEVLDELRRECRPDVIETYPDMALIAVVGRGMARRPGVAAKVFSALGAAGVNIRMIDQGSSEINIILGVETRDFGNSVRAIYRAFVGESSRRGGG